MLHIREVRDPQETNKSWNCTVIEHYEKFIDLWKDAYMWIDEVDDARERSNLK
ncbi:MAG: hypothetical protein WBE11_07420 [Candidatus Aminicenantaceae bacterium]